MTWPVRLHKLHDLNRFMCGTEDGVIGLLFCIYGDRKEKEKIQYPIDHCYDKNGDGKEGNVTDRDRRVEQKGEGETVGENIVEGEAEEKVNGSTSARCNNISMKDLPPRLRGLIPILHCVLHAHQTKLHYIDALHRHCPVDVTVMRACRPHCKGATRSVQGHGRGKKSSLEEKKNCAEKKNCPEETRDISKGNKKEDDGSRNGGLTPKHRRVPGGAGKVSNEVVANCLKLFSTYDQVTSFLQCVIGTLFPM